MERARLTSLTQGKYAVSLIEGDGIGPEISEAVKDIFAAAKVRLKQLDGLVDAPAWTHH